MKKYATTVRLPHMWTWLAGGSGWLTVRRWFWAMLNINGYKVLHTRHNQRPLLLQAGIISTLSLWSSPRHDASPAQWSYITHGGVDHHYVISWSKALHTDLLPALSSCIDDVCSWARSIWFVSSIISFQSSSSSSSIILLPSLVVEKEKILYKK